MQNVLADIHIFIYVHQCQYPSVTDCISYYYIGCVYFYNYIVFLFMLFYYSVVTRRGLRPELIVTYNELYSRYL